MSTPLHPPPPSTTRSTCPSRRALLACVFRFCPPSLLPIDLHIFSRSTYEYGFTATASMPFIFPGLLPLLLLLPPAAAAAVAAAAAAAAALF